MNRYDEIPNELKHLKQWGLFKRIWQPERKKYTKIPHNALDGGAGKSNDPNTWTDFDTAIKALKKYDLDGLGFYFANGYMGIDVDHVENELKDYQSGNYAPDNIVADMVEHTKSYTEISMSGEGIHIIVKGKVPGDRKRKDNVEMYENGRFFAMTGLRINDIDTINSPSKDDLKHLYDEYLKSQNILSMQSNHNKPLKNNLSEHEVIEKALGSSSGVKFKHLMQGDWQSYYTSQSEADLALADMLAFWTGRDFSQMDSIFRSSGLYRPKWDEKHGKTTYGTGTLNRAINDTNDVYTERETLPHYDLSFLNDKKEKEHPQRALNDTGNAERLLDNYKDIIRYSYTDKKWYVYNGTYWEQDNRGFIWKLIDNTVSKASKEKVKLTGDEKNDKKIKAAFNKFQTRIQSHQSKVNMEKETQHHVPVVHGEFDKEPMLLNTKSGYVDLTDGTVEDSTADKMFSKISNAEYTDKADCPEWENFLDVTFNHNQELIDYIQLIVGYSLTGNISEQKMFVLYGNGRNGKSVFLNILQEILGTYGKTINASSLMVKRNASGGANPDIARLEGSRAVFSSESNDGSRLDEGLIKQMTGGEKITARYLYGSDFEYTPQFKLWLATNNKPIIRGTDDGIWRRIVLIPFNHQVPLGEIDKNLTYKLERELPGIFNWAVTGVLKWQKQGLHEPDIIKNASHDYRHEMDPIEQFVESECETGENYRVKASQLFLHYKNWAEQNNQYKYNGTTFGREIKKRFGRKRNNDGNYYVGIKEKNNPELGFLKN